MAASLHLPADVESLTAEQVLALMLEELPGRVALACSFQKEESVLLDMLFALEPNARVFALDTHVLFPETYAVWREVEKRYATKVEVYEGPSLGRQASIHGDKLWESKPDLCCAIRKVEPLNRALAGLDGWITGLRRDQSPSRANAPKVGWDEAHELWKANPLADWNDEQCWEYIRERELPVNPLHERGLRLDRLHALHGRGRRARRPLVGSRQGGVRTPRDPELMAGFVLWFTGLSAAGKTTIANVVAPELEQRGCLVELLDGDVVRTHLSKGLGYSKEDRDINIARIGWVASRLARAGATVIVSAISPYEEMRRHARGLVEAHAPFVEVHVATPIEECARRDPKGLYAQAFAGELDEFTGVSAPYEAPTDPELRLDTSDRTPSESAAAVLARLEELGLVEAEVRG